MSEEQTFATVIAIDNALLTLPCVNRQGAGQDLGRRGGILLFGWSLISYTATRIINDPPKDMLENRCKKPPAGCLY